MRSDNGFRQVTATVNPGAHTNRNTYCNCGVIEASIDAEGKSTAYAYDQQGRKLVTTYPGGGMVTNNYNLLGQVTNVADSAGVGITNCYNNQGMVCVVSNAFGLVRLTKYDIEDHVVMSVDANSVTNSLEYDDLGRMIRHTDGAGNLTTNQYGPFGLISRTDALTNVTRYGYDAAGATSPRPTPTAKWFSTNTMPPAA